jgi:hypothetical protein
MNWSEWHQQYDESPALMGRLRAVREQLRTTLDEFPAGPIEIVSVCAGDGRDLIGVLSDHPRRQDVGVSLLDTDRASLNRGRAAAEAAGVQSQVRFLLADASLARNYVGLVPADLILLSGMIGHLRNSDVPRLVGSLPMLCKFGGRVIWNRHVVLNDGANQVKVIRNLFRSAGFDEIEFHTLAPDGFAVGQVRYTGDAVPLDPNAVLFDFVGLDRLCAAEHARSGRTFSRIASQIPWRKLLRRCRCESA